MFDDVITLLNIATETNDCGDEVEDIEKTTRKDVFAKVNSVGMKETYQALSVGLKPELSFTIADYYDYDNQKAIEYNGLRYSVFRTYRKSSNELEMVVTKDANS